VKGLLETMILFHTQEERIETADRIFGVFLGLLFWIAAVRRMLARGARG